MSSILDDVKKVINIPPDYTAFDTDVMLHLNTAFSILHQLGVGPATAFSVEDKDSEWDDLGLPNHQLNLVKTYLAKKVQMYFDPPATSFVIEATNNQITELEQRIVASAELTNLADT